MNYMGGKERISKRIAAVLNSMACNHAAGYLEPFVGGFSIASRIQHSRIICSDNHTALIAMYNQLQLGWRPPSAISEELYRDIRNARDECDPITAFAGFGASFAGKYFGGYARNNDLKNYASKSRESIIKKIDRQENFQKIRFVCCDYTEHSDVRDMLIYCDPPYFQKTGYKTGDFDSAMFWQWCRMMSEHNAVVVSELTAPADFRCIAEIQVKRRLRRKDGNQEAVTEKLFIHNTRSYT